MKEDDWLIFINNYASEIIFNSLSLWFIGGFLFFHQRKIERKWPQKWKKNGNKTESVLFWLIERWPFSMSYFKGSVWLSTRKQSCKTHALEYHHLSSFIFKILKKWSSFKFLKRGFQFFFRFLFVLSSIDTNGGATITPPHQRQKQKERWNQRYQIV